MTSAEFFKENKYLKLQNLIPKDVATISYNYIKLSALRCENIESNYLIDKGKIQEISSNISDSKGKEKIVLKNKRL